MNSSTSSYRDTPISQCKCCGEEPPEPLHLIIRSICQVGHSFFQFLLNQRCHNDHSNTNFHVFFLIFSVLYVSSLLLSSRQVKFGDVFIRRSFYAESTVMALRLPFKVELYPDFVQRCTSQRRTFILSLASKQAMPSLI